MRAVVGTAVANGNGAGDGVARVALGTSREAAGKVVAGGGLPTTDDAGDVPHAAAETTVRSTRARAPGTRIRPIEREKASVGALEPFSASAKTASPIKIMTSIDRWSDGKFGRNSRSDNDQVDPSRIDPPRRMMRDTEHNMRRQYRVAIPIAAFALYIVPLTAGWLGTSAIELVALPVGATATFWGIRWGALSAAVGLAVGALSYQASGIPPAAAVTLPHLVVVGLLTWTFGSMYGSLRASRRSTADLDRTHAALRAVLADSPIGLTAYDTEGRFTMREGRVLEVLGEGAGERIGEDAHDVFATLYPNQPQLIGYLDQALTGEEASGSIEVSGRSERVHFRPIRDRHGTLVGAVGVAIDDTEGSRSRHLLEQRALHDPLTGLPNRDLFLDRLTQELAMCRRSGSTFATVMIDLDRFKTVNDRFGHAAGDAVLLAVSAELSRAIRETDTAARLGGDEFALVLEHVDHVIAGEIMQRLTAAIQRALKLAGLGVDLGVSCGIAMFPKDGLDNDTLLQHADEAMYRAKRTQRTFLFWTD